MFSEETLQEIAITLGKVDSETREPTDLLVKTLDWYSGSDPRLLQAMKCSSKNAIWSLANGLADCEENHVQRIRILEMLGEFGDEADPVILIMLRIAEHDDDRDVRAAAIKTIGKIGTTPEVAVPTLKRLMDDLRPVIREQAALSLASYGKAAIHAATTKLRLLSNDEYIDVREAADAALRSGR